MGRQQQILSIDLTTGRIEKEPLNQEWADLYLGQRGLATKYLYDNMDPRADPLSPENVLIFATGPLTGTPAPTSSRYSVITKGALTHAIACSNSGGYFGAELKLAGYDLVMIKGAAPEPVYLHIHNSEVTLQPATKLWGKTVWDTEASLKKQHHDPLLKVASIGPAGEAGVRYACIVNDQHRAAGRSGVGAVMGSKNLKAIAVRGTLGIAVKNPEQFLEVVAEKKQKLAGSPGQKSLARDGTNAMMAINNRFGGLPTHNFQAVQFKDADKVGAEAMHKTDINGHRNLQTNGACFSCTIACQRVSRINPNHWSIDKRPQYQIAGGGLEYETAYAFGPLVGVDDIDALTFAGFIANEYGLDPISFGGTLAAAMELYEAGVITKDETGGIALEFGNAEALCILIELTGKYEDFGQTLALGSRLLCEKYGHPEIAMVVKGQEFAGYDSRAMQGMGLGYATSNRGACHMKHNVFSEDMSQPGPENKARPVKRSQDIIAALDSSGLCIFPRGAGWKTDDFLDLINSACNRSWNLDELTGIGERIWNLERLFNQQAGLTKADDNLPPRMLEVPAPSGKAKGLVNDLDLLLGEYYVERGWNSDGTLPESLLKQLQIKL